MKTKALLIAMLALVGCANDPAPHAQLELTEQAFAQANAAGANEELPSWVMARSKLALAKKNMTEQDYKRARVLAEQAELDARVAELEMLKRKDAERLNALAVDIALIRKKLGGNE